MKDRKIIGQKTFLRQMEPKDKTQIKLWDKDDEVSLYREIWPKPKLKSFSFGIYDKVLSRLIGNIGISSIDLKNRHAEIGMTIGDKNYWNKGYGADVVMLTLDYCFNKLNLNKVYLDVWEENKRAIGCYLKCGFKKDGVLRQHVKKDNKYHNKLVMSILKKEWKN